ncbi:MAG: hypothetical protein IT427_07530 [Pirellulales bacterium]|nr:hypothetical protein [Pirellulales bacterium]
MTAPITFTAPVEIQASADRPPRFETLAYTGGAIRVGGYDLPVVIDLSGLSFRKSVTANLDHNPEKRVGHVSRIANDGRELVLHGIVSAVNESVSEFLKSARAGYPWQASVEVSPESIDEVARGQTVIVNGRELTGPIYVIRKGVLSAVAFLASGADDNTTVSIAAKAERAKNMKPAKFEEWAEEMLNDTSLLTNEGWANLHANFCGRSQANEQDRLAVAPLIVASSASDPVEAEEKRLRQIDAAVRGEWENHTEQISELKLQAIAGKYTVDELLQEVRQIRSKVMEEKLPSANCDGRNGYRDSNKTIEAALCLAGGLTNPKKHFAEPILEAADRVIHAASLQQILMSAACNNGYRATPGQSINDGNLRSILAAAFQPQIRASGFSTVSISNVLSNTANKFVLDGWSEIDDPWQKISSVKSVRNFKEHTFIELLDSLEFEELGSGAEIKHGTLADDKMTVQASTYAKMLEITRQDIINDDLGALTDIPRRLGRAAMQKFRRLFWTKFLAADSFFDASNGNVLTGSGSSLDSAGTGLTNAIKKFRAQKSSVDDGAKLIGGKPVICLVPPALEIAGRRLLNSAGIVSGTDGMIPDGNPFNGLCELVVADWAGTDGGLTGGSDVKWYLFRSPSYAPAMLVAALNGKVEPTVETADADFSVLGVQMRGYSDVGVARGEPLCGLQAAGTA